LVYVHLAKGLTNFNEDMDILLKLLMHDETRHESESRMKDDYPYETYYDVVDQILLRDSYTCQICGFYGVENNNATTTVCLECERQGIDFHPTAEWRIPRPCREKQLPYKVCGQCPQYREFSLECVSYKSLVVHHKNGDKTNQNPDNLITVCTSCHRRLHPRGRTLTIGEVKEALQREKQQMSN
jgi:5-methylcytosine-specific restriction endonuclease McrA